MSGSTNWEQVYKVQSARIEQLERENAALWRDVYQCPPTSEYGYEGLKWADAFEVIERDNAELHNKLATLQHQTQWECSCGGTACEGQKENAALREMLARAEVLAEYTHFDGRREWRVIECWVYPNDIIVQMDRAAFNAARAKEIKP